MVDVDAFPRWFEAHQDEIVKLQPQLEFFGTDEPTFRNGIDMKWRCTVCRYNHIIMIGYPATLEQFDIVGKKFIEFYEEAIEHVKEPCEPTNRGTPPDIEFGYYFTPFTDKPEHGSDVEGDGGEGK